MSDKYDKAIDAIKDKSVELSTNEFKLYILEIWGKPDKFEEGCLFQFAGDHDLDIRCGCLTQIRNNPLFYHAYSQEMTEAIVADTRIPADHEKVTLELLPVFAEWQRKIDLELKRG